MPAPAYLAPQNYGGQTTYAGFWIRVVARLVDSLILGIPFSILFIVFATAAGAFAGNTGSDNQSSQNAMAVLFGGAFVIIRVLFW